MKMPLTITLFAHFDVSKDGDTFRISGEGLSVSHMSAVYKTENEESIPDAVRNVLVQEALRLSARAFHNDLAAKAEGKEPDPVPPSPFPTGGASA